MRLVTAALNHRYALLVSLFCTAGGFALGFLVASNIYQEQPPPGPVAQDNRTEKKGPPENKAPKTNSQETTPAPRVPPCVAVLTLYPGMGAELIERMITVRLERLAGEAESVQRVESRSVLGMSLVRVFFAPGVDAGAALAQVGSLVAADLYYLPPGTVPPLVMLTDPLGTAPVGYVVVASEVLDESSLCELAGLQIHNKLQGIPGVIAPAGPCDTRRRIEVELDPVKLQAHALSFLDVQRALAEFNSMRFSGRVLSMIDKEFLLDSRIAPARVEDLMQIPLKSGKNAVYLKDVGQVVDRGAVRSNTTCTRLNGRRQVCLPVYCRPGMDATAVREAVRKALPQMQAGLPHAEGKPAAAVQLRFWPIGVAAARAAKPADNGLITIYLRAPSGTPLQFSEELVAKVERLLEENIPPAERTCMVSELGLGDDLQAVFSQNTGPQDTTLRVQLSAERTATAAEYVRKLRPLFAKHFPNLQASFHAGAEAVAPIVIQVEARDLEAGRKLSDEVRARVARVAGTADVHVRERLDCPSLTIEVDRAKAAALGLSVYDILQEVEAATTLGPTVSPPFWVDDRSGNLIVLRVRNAEGPVTRPDDLSKLLITPKQGAKPVPLGDLVKLQQTTVPSEIHRVNLTRVFTIHVNLDGRDLRSVVGDIEEALRELTVPDGMRIQISR